MICRAGPAWKPQSATATYHKPEFSMMKQHHPSENSGTGQNTALTCAASDTSASSESYFRPVRGEQRHTQLYSPQKHTDVHHIQSAEHSLQLQQRNQHCQTFASCCVHKVSYGSEGNQMHIIRPGGQKQTLKQLFHFSEFMLRTDKHSVKVKPGVTKVQQTKAQISYEPKTRSHDSAHKAVMILNAFNTQLITN